MRADTQAVLRNPGVAINGSPAYYQDSHDLRFWKRF
jgi:hypothetical protein